MYTFELARSEDFFRYGDLWQAKGKSLSLSLNKPGSFQFSMSLEDNPLSDYIEERTSCVIVKLDGYVVWSGPVWTIEEQTPNTINVGCVGWLQTLDGRIIHPDWANSGPNLVYTDTDAGVIALDLLSKSNSDTSEHTNFVVPGTYEATIGRTRTYAAYAKILDEITALSTIESGFDFEVDPVTRALNIYSIKRNYTDANFIYGKNIQDASRNSDSSRMVNKIYVYGAPNTTVQISIDEASINKYGLIEEAVSLSDVKDNTILAAYGQAELAIRANPLRLIGFSPAKYVPGRNDPKLFEDFFIGDVVYTTVRKDRFDVDKQAVRIFGAGIAWDQNGNFQITQVQSTAQ